MKSRIEKKVQVAVQVAAAMFITLSAHAQDASSEMPRNQPLRKQPVNMKDWQTTLGLGASSEASSHQLEPTVGFETSLNHYAVEIGDQPDDPYDMENNISHLHIRGTYNVVSTPSTPGAAVATSVSGGIDGLVAYDNGEGRKGMDLYVGAGASGALKSSLNQQTESAGFVFAGPETGVRILGDKHVLTISPTVGVGYFILDQKTGPESIERVESGNNAVFIGGQVRYLGENHYATAEAYQNIPHSPDPMAARGAVLNLKAGGQFGKWGFYGQVQQISANSDKGSLDDRQEISGVPTNNNWTEIRVGFTRKLGSGK